MKLISPAEKINKGFINIECVVWKKIVDYEFLNPCLEMLVLDRCLVKGGKLVKIQPIRQYGFRLPSKKACCLKPCDIADSCEHVCILGSILFNLMFRMNPEPVSL